MTTLTLQPDATAGKDCQITSASPTFNNGVTTTLVGSNVTRGLLEFDLSSIPATAVCDNATLYLYQSSTGAAAAFTITVRQIAVGNTAWVEGTSNNVQALAGHPCWNALAANGSGGVTTPWAGSAGLATPTTDYETPNIGTTISGDRSNPNGTEYSSVLTPARVQGWFGASNTNHGLLLQPSATVGGIASSDNTTAAWRPKLVVNYTDVSPQTVSPNLLASTALVYPPTIFGAVEYTYLLTVSGGVYTATNPVGTTVISNADLKTVIDFIKNPAVKIQFGVGTFDYGANHTTFNDLDGIEFWGMGIDVTYVQNNQDDIADTEPFSFTRCDNVVIRNMTVAAYGIARSSSDCIDNDGGSGWLVENVKITASRARGIAQDGKDPGASAIGNIIRNCIISGTQGALAGDGIELLATVNCIIENNTITSVAAHGIQMSKGAGVSGTKGSGNIIRNNTIILAGRDGINIVSCDDNEIRDNTITNSATVTTSKDGVRIETSDGVACDGNIVDGNIISDDRTPQRQRWGVNIGPTTPPLANNSAITNNDLRGNLLAPYMDVGTDTFISGNLPAGLTTVAPSLIVSAAIIHPPTITLFSIPLFPTSVERTYQVSPENRTFVIN